MRIIMLGAPGAGKGTQAAMLSEKFGIPHISTGDIFRANIKSGTELGKKAKGYIEKGELVPDEITIGIVKDRLQQSDCKTGFVLDGFPRTIPQAEYLDKALESMHVTIDYCLDIKVEDSEIVKRMSGRRMCTGCGASYHTIYNPTSKEGICNACGSAVIQRDDDKEETVLNRLKTYHEQTEPLEEYYKARGKLLMVKGQEAVEDTTRHVLEALGVK